LRTPTQEGTSVTHFFISEDTVAYKEIIVYLDSSPDSDNRLNLAIAMAASHGARLIGVDACSDAAFEGQWRDRAVELPDMFESTIKEAGVRGAYRVLDRTGKGAQHYYSHYADLIIASQPEPESRTLIMEDIPEGVLLAAGVPVLLLPSGLKSRAAFENIVIAWKPSREATRAVHDAMPLLTKAKKVTAFTFAPHIDALDKGANLLIDHLREHGVIADVDSWPDTGEISVADGLFACLETQEADLIVAGAYGHSRLFEGLFGGVSRDLVRQPSLPILMSH
jgi:nucleotide-binding universal stress UspA family protein